MTVLLNVDAGFIPAIIAAVFLGAVFSLDALMQQVKVYTAAVQPIIISSIFALVTVPLLFLFGSIQLPTSMVLITALSGGLVLALGQVFYMMVLYSENGDSIESSVEMSIYDNASPILILLAIWIFSLFGYTSHDDISSWQISGSVIVVLGVIFFSFLNAKERIKFDYKYHLLLVGFTIAIASYLWIEDVALQMMLNSAEISKTDAYLSVSVWFWLGFGSCTFALFNKKMRNSFMQQVPVIWKNFWLVIVAELCAIISFWATIMSLSFEHVLVTSVVIGTYPLFVIIGNILLRKYHPDIPSKSSTNYTFIKYIIAIGIAIGIGIVYLL